jgi:hypothetical protein
MTAPATRPQLRYDALRLRPASLKGEGGDAMVYTVHTVSDGILDWFLSGVMARFPTYCPDDGLSRQQRDRRIIRGLAEPADSFRERLRRYRHTHKTMGNAYSVLRALGGFLAPHAVAMRLWTDDGMVYSRAADGTLSWLRRLGDWDWDSTSAPERFWVVIYPPSTLWTIAPADGMPGPWVLTATPEQIAGVREVILQSKSINSECAWIIVALDPASFDLDAPEPDGDWDRWGVGTTPRAANRLSTARYWRGQEVYQ